MRRATREWLVVMMAMFPLAGVLWAQGGEVSDQPPGGEGTPVRVRIELHGPATPIEGLLELPGVTLKTPTGSQTVESRYLRRITLSPEAGDEAIDTVQTTDKEVLRGHLLTPAFPVRVGQQTLSFSRKEIREIRVLQERGSSLLAILLGLTTLSAMEIVLGIDNIIFLAIVAGRLPVERQPAARRIGLIAALGTRLGLLFTLSWMLGLTAAVFTLPDLPLFHDLEAREISWRDLILFTGGLFLIGKSVREMHEKLEAAKEAHPGAFSPPAVAASFGQVIATIAVIDIIFSLDSVITAVGMVDELWVMVVAMLIAMTVMMVFAEPIARFVNQHPTLKVLALAFLILIGVMLVAEALGQHLDKGYIYFAMSFAVVVEMINMRLRRASQRSRSSEAVLPGGQAASGA